MVFGADNAMFFRFKTVILKIVFMQNDIIEPNQQKPQNLPEQPSHSEGTNSSSEFPATHASPAFNVTKQHESFTDHLKPQLKREKHHPSKKSGGILSFFATILIALILVQVINMFLFQSYRVIGSSMFPTLNEGDLLIISRIGKTSAKVKKESYQPSRGDIIVFQSPVSELRLVKRVIGLPGERVVAKSGKLTVYNKENPSGFNPDKGTEYEDDIPTITSGNVDITVPKGHLFVSGDNREGSNSLDSRNELGTISQDLVAGKLSVRIWPLSDARFF